MSCPGFRSSSSLDFFGWSAALARVRVEPFSADRRLTTSGCDSLQVLRFPLVLFKVEQGKTNFRLRIARVGIPPVPPGFQPSFGSHGGNEASIFSC